MHITKPLAWYPTKKLNGMKWKVVRRIDSANDAKLFPWAVVDRTNKWNAGAFCARVYARNVARNLNQIA